MKKNSIWIAVVAIIVAVVVGVVIFMAKPANNDNEVNNDIVYVATVVDGVGFDGGTEIVNNVPMVKGEVLNSSSEYLTFEEVEALGYNVVIADDTVIINKIQNIENNVNNDVNIENPGDSTDIIEGNKPADDVEVGDKQDETDKGTETENPEKDETPNNEHTHKYNDTVVKATCVDAGYTKHTCECGHEYEDSVVAATGHSYVDKVVAPTTSAKGYTEHTCSVCGNSYRDNYKDAIVVETPTHTHSYKETVIAPTCTEPGHTVLTCDCGDSYVDFVKPELGHDYKKTVVAPTTESEGFTEFDCTRCTHSYKDHYTEKLPKPTTPDSSDTDWENTGGTAIEGKEHSTGNAGSLPEIPGTTRYVFNKDLSLSQNISKLNGYLFDVYGFRMFGDGLSLNEGDKGHFAKFVYKDGRFGIQVFGWRKSYDSDYGTGEYLNGVMECMYALCGDRDVAYALWSVMDYLGINGSAATTTSVVEGFGFVCSNETSNGINLTMNGVTISWVWGSGNYNTFYFS